MAKTFYARDEGNGFKVAIFEDGYRGTGTDDLFTNPMGSANSNYLYFHSNLSFFRSPISITQTIIFDAKTVGQDCGKKKGACVKVPSSGTTTRLISSGNYSNKIVIATDSVSGRSLAGTTFVQTLGDSSFRTITIYSNSTGIYIDEQWLAYSNNLPEYTTTIKVYILSTTTENRTDSNEVLYIDPTNMRVNAGLFNSNLGYVDVNTDSVTYTATNVYSSWFCSWNPATDSTNGIIRRYVSYLPDTNQTNYFWDAFYDYKENIQGIHSIVTGQVASVTIGDYVYERGVLKDTVRRTNGTIKFYIYEIRRSVTISNASRLVGNTFPNGPTLKVVSNTDGTGAAFSYSYDGYKASYGNITTYPTNTVFNLNLS